MKSSIAIGILLIAYAVQSLSASPRPNIILAMADDQGWRDVAYNADPDRGLQTPHMDQMAREGIRFNRFYSSSPNCSPTRAAVMTGRNCHRSGVFNHGYALHPRELTIAEVLQKEGYATAHFGKWHLGPVKASSPVNPHAHGFDYYVSHDNYFELNPELSRNGADPETFPGEGSEVIVDEALKYLDTIKDTGKPFFLVVWFGSPHTPHEGLQKDKNLYSHLSEEWQNYYGEITAMDRAMGNLRSGLKERALDKNTLIWYTSDNGSHKPAKEIKGLRGFKGQTWEGGIRVPCMIVWPEKITQPLETDLSASTSDIMPTLIDLLGITQETPKFDGMSILPLLQGKEMTERSKPMAFWRANSRAKEAVRQNPLHFSKEELKGWWRSFKCPNVATPQTDDFSGDAVWLDGDWKMHKRDGDIELYNLELDPAETNDVADEHPELVEKFAAELLSWQREVERSLAGADFN